MKRMIIPVLFSMLLLASLAAEELSPGIVDNYTGDPELHIIGSVGVLNPLFGLHGQVEFRRLGGGINAGVSGGYGLVSILLDTNILPLVGSDGPHAAAWLGFRLAEVQRNVRTFVRTGIVSATTTTTTYSGYRMTIPVHDSHWLQLGLRLEPTSVLEEYGYDPDSLQKTYAWVPGSTFFVFPHYRYETDTCYKHETSNKPPVSSTMGISVGPVFAPDFSRVGALFEVSGQTNRAGWNLWITGSLGFVLRLDLPDDILIATGATHSNINRTNPFLSGYMPMNVSFGASYTKPLAKGNSK